MENHKRLDLAIYRCGVERDARCDCAITISRPVSIDKHFILFASDAVDLEGAK